MDRIPPNITVNYVEQHPPKRGWPLWFVAICIFLSIAACGQCGRWIGF